MATYLDRDAILNAPDLDVKEVEVPEWGGTVLIKPLSGRERDAYEQSNLKQTSKGSRLNLENARARLVSLCVVDEQGNKLFTKDDVKQLGKKSAAALDRVVEVARDASGLGDSEEADMALDFEEPQEDGEPSS